MNLHDKGFLQQLHALCYVNTSRPSAVDLFMKNELCAAVPGKCQGQRILMVLLKGIHDK